MKREGMWGAPACLYIHPGCQPTSRQLRLDAVVEAACGGRAMPSAIAVAGEAARPPALTHAASSEGGVGSRRTCKIAGGQLPGTRDKSSEGPISGGAHLHDEKWPSSLVVNSWHAILLSRHAILIGAGTDQQSLDDPSCPEDRVTQKENLPA